MLKIKVQGDQMIVTANGSEEDRLRDIESLEQQLEELHDASEHTFADDGKGRCRKCGWFNPKGPRILRGGHTLRQGAEQVLEALKNPPIVIEVVFVEVSDQRLPDWWPFNN